VNSRGGDDGAVSNRLLKRVLRRLRDYRVPALLSTIHSSHVAVAVDSNALANVDVKSLLGEVSQLGKAWTANSKALVSRWAGYEE
jgi:hypothetical protein